MQFVSKNNIWPWSCCHFAYPPSSLQWFPSKPVRNWLIYIQNFGALMVWCRNISPNPKWWRTARGVKFGDVEAGPERVPVQKDICCSLLFIFSRTHISIDFIDPSSIHFDCNMKIYAVHIFYYRFDWPKFHPLWCNIDKWITILSFKNWNVETWKRRRSHKPNDGAVHNGKWKWRPPRRSPRRRKRKKSRMIA